MTLSSKQKKCLKALAHHLEPVIRIGKFGVTPTLTQTVRESLTALELIKIKVLENAEIDLEEAAEILVEKANSALVQTIGRIIVLYRANPELKDRIEFPGMVPSKNMTADVPGKKTSKRPKSSISSRRKGSSPGKKTKRDSTSKPSAKSGKLAIKPFGKHSF
ncbi:MAG: ribosome assembly RNA-binding protein YhbY [Candidatus Riflebacteria bacterium]|nr:ribosome assembly RNA-binding protein YhbY [Candidatus Riflebacteria bacterium]